MLKKEVAELRAHQATTSTPGMQIAQTSMVEEQVKQKCYHVCSITSHPYITKIS